MQKDKKVSSKTTNEKENIYIQQQMISKSNVL